MPCEPDDDPHITYISVRRCDPAGVAILLALAMGLLMGGVVWLPGRCVI